MRGGVLGAGQAVESTAALGGAFKAAFRFVGGRGRRNSRKLSGE